VGIDGVLRRDGIVEGGILSPSSRDVAEIALAALPVVKHLFGMVFCIHIYPNIASIRDRLFSCR